MPKLEIGEGEEFAGTFHTHPYEYGTIGMVFSGINIACAINDGEKISIWYKQSMTARRAAWGSWQSR
jgi:hypothetical protein